MVIDLTQEGAGGCPFAMGAEIAKEIVTCALNKRRGYLSGNKEDLRIVQSQRKRIREREGCYREEMEVQLHQNNHSGV